MDRTEGRNRTSFHCPALEKEMATHSSVLAWRIPGTREPGGLPSMGSHRVGHDWSNLAEMKLIRSELIIYPKLQCCLEAELVMHFLVSNLFLLYSEFQNKVFICATHYWKLHVSCWSQNLNSDQPHSGGGGLFAKLCPTLMTSWTIACQTPLSMGFSKQEYWGGLLFPSQGIFLTQGSNLHPQYWKWSPVLQQILYCWATR